MLFGSLWHSLFLLKWIFIRETSEKSSSKTNFGTSTNIIRNDGFRQLWFKKFKSTVVYCNRTGLNLNHDDIPLYAQMLDHVVKLKILREKQLGLVSQLIPEIRKKQKRLRISKGKFDEFFWLWQIKKFSIDRTYFLNPCGENDQLIVYFNFAKNGWAKRS